MVKSIKRIATYILSLCLSVGVCSIVANNSASAKVSVSGITVKAPYNKSVNIAKGKKVSITPVVNVKPDKKKNKQVIYKSLNTKIAKISRKGVITGLKTGSTNITLTSVKDKTKSISLKVKVVKTPVSKIKFDKKTANVKPGDKFAIKAVIMPQKAGNKKIVWSTSNKKVATVDKNGNVTAVTAGQSVIKAFATDGSVVSAKCKVVVEEVTDIVKVNSMNENTIDLTLSKPDTIKATDIKIYSKKSYEGRFNTEHAVAIAQSEDNTNYRITLAKNEIITEYSYIKVIINSLSGKKEYATKVVFPDDSIALPELVITSDTASKETMTCVDFGNKIKGEPNFKVEGLPNGYSTIVKNGLIYIYGKSDTVLDNVVATISAEDEFANKSTVNVRFLVGNTTTIVHYIEPISVMSNKTGKYYSRVYFAGGSGELKYEIANPDDISSKYPGIKVSRYTDDCIEFENDYVNNVTTGKKVPAIFAAGTYSFGVIISDSKNNTMKKEAVLSVESKPVVTISGILIDAAGQPVTSRMVYAVCTSKNIYNAHNVDSIYSYNKVASNAETDSTGKFTIDVPEGETYTVSGCGAYQWNVKPQAGGCSINLKSPYFKVNFVFPVENAAKVFGTVGNYDINNEVIHEYTASELRNIDDHFTDNKYTIVNGSGYFLPGKYHLKTDNLVTDVLNAYSDNGTWMGKYSADVEFTVDSSDISVSAVMTKL